MRVFTLARAFYIQLREGKPHSKQIKEQDITRMPGVDFNGSLEFNPESVLGGHVAFFISAMISKKARKSLNFIFKNFVTLNTFSF